MILMGFLMLLEQHQDREGKPSLDQRIQTYSNKLKKKKKQPRTLMLHLLKKQSPCQVWILLFANEIQEAAHVRDLCLIKNN